MFLIPYVYRKKESIYPVHTIYIFLNAGVELLNAIDNVDSFCSINGLYFKKKTVVDDKCYVELDLHTTDINSFYTYHENSDAECFRRFICVGDMKEDYLHINSTNPEFIREVLEEVLRLST